MENEKYLKKIRTACTAAIPILLAFLVLPVIGAVTSAVYGFIEGWNEAASETPSNTPELTVVGGIKMIFSMISAAVLIVAVVCMVISVIQLFIRLRKSESPFTELSSKKVRNVGIFLMLIDPAYTLFFLLAFDELQITLGLHFSAGILIYCFSLIFKYGAYLQQQSDETL